MNTLFLECKMGAAGDMLAAALLELHPEPEKILKQLNEIGLPNVIFKIEPSIKCGIQGKHFTVLINGVTEKSCDIEHHHEHVHNHIHDDKCHHHNHCHEHQNCPHLNNNKQNLESEELFKRKLSFEFIHDNQEECHEHHHEENCQEHSHNHHHEHHGLHEIEHLVKDHLNIPSKVKEDVLAVYQIIAEAESKVHGVPITEIHFHEVGSLDAVADITAVCLLINELKPDKIIASPINLGNGQVKCAHGILPVPAPATALILKDIPVYSGNIESELCTPTGAALLKHFVNEFGNQPIMRVEKIGYGMGTKDFNQANCLRAILGETSKSDEEVVELCCNIDDMTAEEIAFAMERLFEAGALDVYTISAGMKKNRPGILFTCMCEKSCRDNIIKLMFKHTSTIGIRENICNRYVLKRQIDNLYIEDDEVKIKKVSGYGTTREKYEYNDLAKIALKHNFSLKEAREWVEVKQLIQKIKEI